MFFTGGYSAHAKMHGRDDVLCVVTGGELLDII